MAESENKNLEIIAKIDKCSPSNCFFNQDSDSKDFLKRRRCQRHVHYVFRELPVYQITFCLTFKSRSFENIGEEEETDKKVKHGKSGNR